MKEAEPVVFQSRVERLEPDMGRMHAIPVPDFILADLGLETHYRVIVRIAGQELKRAILAPKSGQPYLIVGNPHLRGLGLAEGSPVEITMRAESGFIGGGRRIARSPRPG